VYVRIRQKKAILEIKSKSGDITLVDRKSAYTLRYISTRETESRHCRTNRPTRGHCMVTYDRLQATTGSFIVIIFSENVKFKSLLYSPPVKIFFSAFVIPVILQHFYCGQSFFLLPKYFISASISQGLIL
jgi:hypothetical protein